MASVWNRLGVVCLKLDEVPDAFDYLVRAIEKRADLEMRSEAARTLLTLGTAHERRGELSQAIAVWHLSANLQKKLRDYEWLARTCFELGRSYGRMRRTMQRGHQSEIVVVFDASSFWDSRELRALRMLSGMDNPPPVVVKRERLVSMAREQLEAAIWWETEASGTPYASLAHAELKALQERESQPVESMHEPKKNGDRQRKRR